MAYLTKEQRSKNNHAIRRERMIVARSKGRHSKNEWLELKNEFGGLCVICLCESGLLNVEKDHIIPIFSGGSDSIENIQPLCARCNCGKSGSFNWKEFRRGQRGLD